MPAGVETNISQLFELDLQDVLTRIAKYKKKLIDSDMVVVTLVCSDSRVVLPIEPLSVQMDDGTEKMMVFIGVPTIGGGFPSKSRTRGVIRTLERWGVPKEKIKILVTQHSDGKERNAGKAEPECKITCGLRNLLSKYEVELTSIREQLMVWSRRYKQQLNDPTAAPDRLELSVIGNAAPEIMAEVVALHKKTGLPRRLIIRAAYRNSSFDIKDNLLESLDKVAEYVAGDEYADMYLTCLVAAAYYDHLQKELEFPSKYADLGMKSDKLPLGLKPRTDSVQKPRNVVISFGEDAICLHNGVILPHFAGAQSLPDDVFRACASISSVPTVLCAFAEAFYAVVHKVHPHERDANFSTLERVIVVCDSDEQEEIVYKALQSDEFKQDFLPVFSQFNNGEITVVNLHADREGMQSEYKTLAVAA